MELTRLGLESGLEKQVCKNENINSKELNAPSCADISEECCQFLHPLSIPGTHSLHKTIRLSNCSVIPF